MINLLEYLFGTSASTGRVRKGLTPPPTQARGGDYFPNVLVRSHRGEKFRLYDDLIRNRVVMINFMSLGAHDKYPVSQHLSQIAERLGPRLGRDVFMYSITTDPERDTPARLKELAERYGDKKGWHFLTASKDNIEAVSGRLFKHGGNAGGGNVCVAPGQDSSHPARLVHYGNGSLGIWGAFGVDCNPELAVERLSWVENGKKPTGALRRAGPRRLAADFMTQNRET